MPEQLVPAPIKHQRQQLLRAQLIFPYSFQRIDTAIESHGRYLVINGYRFAVVWAAAKDDGGVSVTQTVTTLAQCSCYCSCYPARCRIFPHCCQVLKKRLV